MGFDRDALIAACRARPRVARVVVAQVRGSAPREVGAAMLVWADGQSGTIGGGTLEHDLTLAARALLGTGGDRLTRHALGPDMGQCCGGAVQVLTEVYDLERAQALAADLIARGPGPEPLAVTRIRAQARGTGQLPDPRLIDGWMVEPVARRDRAIWIWGAGHVGRALVDVLAPLPDVAITWIDSDSARYPETIPHGVTQLPAADPAMLVRHAPAQAEHLIVTYSHALDLALCHALLGHGFGFAGLIGSATKWARFRNRLRDLGHSDAQIARITCPIGHPELGKHPHIIAIGVAQDLLSLAQTPQRNMSSLA
ncbi:xanthine dehydrogenase accessory protein XdhC [Sulfitobacter sabulilitoris]|uniref:Xanthine dehydrogenase accessory protein XdhC n=1 Tax=Sulfitobacter sabulilitoris TaxID=2562655 RepID=A0A5S3PCH2_9RHOB|nr:xanthine dehydrogenase accessory protein XdhC [Sulfitobacter sabulilitoris]TMM51553.1 xanthine dehydrogenase accessory protein XdhC [Sulfitobacter sabulilitoris]